MSSPFNVGSRWVGTDGQVYRVLETHPSGFYAVDEEDGTEFTFDEEGMCKENGNAVLLKDRVYGSEANSKQVGGSHYAGKSIQPWDAMESWMNKEAFSGYLQGNVIKYISRFRDKNGIEDLEKAKHYLEKLIEQERK